MTLILPYLASLVYNILKLRHILLHIDAFHFQHFYTVISTAQAISDAKRPRLPNAQAAPDDP